MEKGNQKKFAYVILLSFIFLLLNNNSFAQGQDIELSPVYTSGSLKGQVPQGGLAASSDVSLGAILLDPRGESICDGSKTVLRYAMAHAIGGDTKKIEYLKKGLGVTFDYTFNSGTAGQKNMYWPIFYCSNFDIDKATPVLAVNYDGSKAKFDQTTVTINPDTIKPPSTTTSTSSQSFSFNIENPLKGGASDFTSLVKIIAQWIFNLAIPIAVAMIVYAGILFLTAAGDTSKVTKAKEVLKYAVIGLAIILIGSGFVTLIQSILELGGTGTTQDQGPGLPVEPQLPTSGAVGNKCSKDRDCVSGLKCSNSICQRPTGNLLGEWCVGGVSCAQGLACDKTNDSIEVIDGQTLGKCYQP